MCYAYEINKDFLKFKINDVIIFNPSKRSFSIFLYNKLQNSIGRHCKRIHNILFSVNEAQCCMFIIFYTFRWYLSLWKFGF